MTLLEQLLEKKGFSDTYLTDDLETINEIKLIKMAIKEWLQQKLDNYEQNCNYIKQYHQALEELLKELQ